MGVGVVRQTFYLAAKYRVTTLTREEWIRGPVTHYVVKGLVWFWFTDEPRMMEGTGPGAYGQSLGRRLSICQGNMLQFFRLKYMLPWPVSIKFKQELDQRHTSVFALTVRCL
jgi:hypothetical protein